MRPATSSDLEGLAALAAELHSHVIGTGIAPFAARPDEVQLHEALFGPAPCAQAFVADAGLGDLDGFAFWHRVYSVREGHHTLHVDELYVGVERRAAGVGSDLFRALGREAIASGCSYLTWDAVRWDSRRVGLGTLLRAAPLDELLTYSVDARHLQRLIES